MPLLKVFKGAILNRRNLANVGDESETPDAPQVIRLRSRVLGQEDAFPRPRLSARCRLSQGTFAGTRGNERNAL